MGNVETRMMELAETGNLKGLDQLLHSSPVDLQYQDKNGYTALHLAAKNGHFKCADLLIDRGVDLHTLDNQGATALHYACLSGSVKVIKRIITANPDLVIVKNKKERTPLHFLCIACGEGKDWVEVGLNSYGEKIRKYGCRPSFFFGYFTSILLISFPIRDCSFH
eukprot:TRINITY_DN8920_c0_g1_i2.p1 TRINITY_DN8920_c0_g1~~TRINITY_DN8920_c0_g1_i2.p1  ORF type:complete len:165 (-),score=24.51 TRINITY_DN8920_c0_g1_i2:16-510(-)